SFLQSQAQADQPEHDESDREPLPKAQFFGVQKVREQCAHDDRGAPDGIHNSDRSPAHGEGKSSGPEQCATGKQRDMPKLAGGNARELQIPKKLLPAEDQQGANADRNFPNISRQQWISLARGDAHHEKRQAAEEGSEQREKYSSSPPAI